MRNLCKEFHLPPHMVEEIDIQTIEDWGTIGNIENQVKQDAQQEAEREAKREAERQGRGF